MMIGKSRADYLHRKITKQTLIGVNAFESPPSDLSQYQAPGETRAFPSLDIGPSISACAIRWLFLPVPSANFALPQIAKHLWRHSQKSIKFHTFTFIACAGILTSSIQVLRYGKALIREYFEIVLKQFDPVSWRGRVFWLSMYCKL